jgi:hypothetical protein
MNRTRTFFLMVLLTILFNKARMHLQPAEIRNTRRLQRQRDCWKSLILSDQCLS